MGDRARDSWPALAVARIDSGAHRLVSMPVKRRGDAGMKNCASPTGMEDTDMNSRRVLR